MQYKGKKKAEKAGGISMIKKRLVGLLSHAKKQIAYNILWQWIALLVQITAVFSIGGLLDQVNAGRSSTEYIWKTAAVLIVCIGARFLCEKMAARASYLAGADVKRILREKIYEKMLRLGAAYRDYVSTSEVVQVSTEGVEQLEIYFGKYLPQLFYSLLAPVTLFAVLGTVSWKAGGVLLLCVPLIPVSIVAVQKIAGRLLKKYWSIYTGLGDSFLENLQGLTTLKIYEADERKAAKMDEEAQHFRRITMKVLTMQLNSTTVMDIIAYGGAAVGMITAVVQLQAGSISFGGTVKIILLASEFFIPLRLLGSFFHIAMNGMSASDRIFRILDLPQPDDGTKVPEAGAGLPVLLQNVRFSYEADREILKGVDILLPAGGFVSLVGESGCGKSTVAGLIAGKNRGYEGKVLLAGIPVEDIKEAERMRRIVLVRHNSYLFKGTVRENLQMAKPGATEEEMNEVLARVNLLDFMNTQDGLSTKLSEQASNLSGGQRQRLALARALLADAPVYIFDEATSNIDAESEEQIMSVIHELAGTKTVLLISHRLANVTGSDCIYMMKDGKAVEAGTHEQLMKQEGEYSRLYRKQAELENYGKEGKANAGN